MWVPMMDPDVHAPTIKEQILFMFPPVPAGEIPPQAFTITLAHIAAAGLTVVATQHAHEHLEIMDNQVKIMEFTEVTEHHFLHFYQNRVAM
jgi:hypothetical protein